jgi:hypothetical protein
MLYQLSYSDESKGGLEPPSLMPHAKKERFYRPLFTELCSVLYFNVVETKTTIWLRVNFLEGSCF